MAITHVNVANSQATGATQIVHTLPASLATGDVVVVGVSASGSTDLTFTEPGGTWTPIADLYSDDGRDTNFGVFLKVMGAVPDTDVTISVGATANLGAISTAKRGVDTTTPLDVASVTATGINTPDADPGSITPVTNGAEVIVLGSWGRADGTITFPSGYTNTTSRQVAGGGTACALGSKNIATAGPENPGIFDLSTGDTSDAWTAVTVALRPAGGGGSTYTLDADAGSYAITGTAAALERGYLIDADAGSYAITGQDAALQQGYQVVADAGAYAISGSDADFIYNRAIDADAGSYLINGADASLEYTPSGSTYNLDAEGGAYLITGSDAALDYVQLIHRILDADVGSYLISGSDALLEYSGAPSSVQGVMLRPGGVTHNRRTKAQKDTRRRRILLPDGRILIPADDAEYRRAVDQIVANLESGEESAEPPKPARKRLRGAVVAPAAVPKLAPVQALPAEFYTSLEFHRQGVLNYLSILAAWQAYLAEMDEDEAVTLLLLN